jgi:hypothetical protein
MCWKMRRARRRKGLRGSRMFNGCSQSTFDRPMISINPFSDTVVVNARVFPPLRKRFRRSIKCNQTTLRIMANRLFYGPMQKVYSFIEKADSQASFFCPFRKSQRFAIESVSLSVALISSLFFSSRPSSIRLFVVPVYVRESIKAMLRRWPWTNIGKKHCEVFPFIGDFNTSSAIVRIVWALRISAATEHPTPSLILRSTSAVSWGVTVNSPTRPAQCANAVVAMGSSSDPSGVCSKYRAALTSTVPLGAILTRSSVFDYIRSAKSLSRQIDKFTVVVGFEPHRSCLT